MLESGSEYLSPRNAAFSIYRARAGFFLMNAAASTSEARNALAVARLALIHFRVAAQKMLAVSLESVDRSPGNGRCKSCTLVSLYQNAALSLTAHYFLYRKDSVTIVSSGS